MTRLAYALCLAVVAAAAAGCGSSGPSSGLTVQKARTFQLANFRPGGSVQPGRPVKVGFTIEQPSGQPLTAYKTCCEPHAGVDLIVVRADDSRVQYLDTDIAPDGRVTEPVTFPAPGRYRIVVDAYPKQTSPNAPFNFQLFAWVTVRGKYRPQPVPAYKPAEAVHGYRFQIQGHPRLKPIQPNFLTIKVLDPAGRKAVFTTWRGALAHAIFFHADSLDYFHTHVCNPGAVYCFSALGGARVTGHSTAPGVLKVGILLPEGGTWRMFLLTYMHGHVLTAPFTFHAR